MRWFRQLGVPALPILAVALFGVAETLLTQPPGGRSVLARLIVSVTATVAVALHRARPGLATAIFWLGASAILAADIDIMFVQLSVVVVYFGLARWARARIAWLWILITPIGYVVAAAHVQRHGTSLAGLIGLSSFASWSTHPIRVFAVAAVLPVMVPLIVGLLLRLQHRARTAEQGRESALEVAAEKTYQTQLARDVHDVVGHSLATILIQAESGQYMEADPDQLKAAMARIAGSARESLVEVRSILESTPGRSTELEEVIAVVQRAGARVDSRIEGTPRALPPDVATVAVRVLQEMLTNALRHGLSDGVIRVQRVWRDGLTITTTNDCRSGPGLSGQREGTGLSGMRHRVQAVGGRLDIVRSESHFTVRAWLPSSSAFGPAAP